MPQDMKVYGQMSSAKPDYSLAWMIGDRIRELMEDPKEKAAFLEWEKAYDEKQKGA